MIAAMLALGYWIWIIGGLLLMLVELLAPGLFFIWLGLAALATGAAAWMLDLGWAMSAIVFVAFAVGSVFAGRAITGANGSKPESASNLNALSQDLIGKTYRLDHAIKNGEGRLRIGDTVWRAHGDDIAAGERVRIVRLDGTALVVERS